MKSELEVRARISVGDVTVLAKEKLPMSLPVIRCRHMCMLLKNHKACTGFTSVRILVY